MRFGLSFNKSGCLWAFQVSQLAQIQASCCSFWIATLNSGDRVPRYNRYHRLSENIRPYLWLSSWSGLVSSQSWWSNERERWTGYFVWLSLSHSLNSLEGDFFALKMAPWNAFSSESATVFLRPVSGFLIGGTMNSNNNANNNLWMRKLTNRIKQAFLRAKYIHLDRSIYRSW